jgi:DNA-binding PadR family transcriptional regulator
MTSPFPSRGSGPSLSDAFDHLRSAVEQRISSRADRAGDLRAEVLAVLAEKPSTGAGVITEIGVRSGGSWKPSAGEVYPLLQLLVDEGVIASEVTGGRKTYTLTDEGQAEADAAASRAGAGSPSGKHELFGPLPKAGMELAQAAAQVQRSGTPDQQKQAAALLDEVRRKLYAILAQD